MLGITVQTLLVKWFADSSYCLLRQDLFLNSVFAATTIRGISIVNHYRTKLIKKLYYILGLFPVIESHLSHWIKKIIWIIVGDLLACVREDFQLRAFSRPVRVLLVWLVYKSEDG